MNFLQNIYDPTRLFLVWRCAPNKGARDRRVVAVIERSSINEEVCLHYLSSTDDYRRAEEAGFEGYPAFDPSISTHCKGVVDAFMRRMPPRKRDDFKAYLQRHRLPVAIPLSDLALLAYTNAKLPSDGFELYPDLTFAMPPLDLVIEVAGFRHQHNVSLDEIYLGDPVVFKAEAENQHDENATGVYYGGLRIGFVDRAQAPAFRRWLRLGLSITGVVERIDGTADRPAVHIFVSIR